LVKTHLYLTKSIYSIIPYQAAKSTNLDHIAVFESNRKVLNPQALKTQLKQTSCKSLNPGYPDMATPRFAIRQLRFN